MKSHISLLIIKYKYNILENDVQKYDPLTICPQITEEEMSMREDDFFAMVEKLGENEAGADGEENVNLFGTELDGQTPLPGFAASTPNDRRHSLPKFVTPLTHRKAKKPGSGGTIREERTIQFESEQGL